MNYLKIAIICYPTVGGSGVVATNLGKELAALGHQAHFISYDEPFQLNLKRPNLYFHKVKINDYPLFKYPDYTLPLAEAILEVHKKHKLDVVHVHYAVPHATAALFARRLMLISGIKPPKVVTTLHGTDITLLAADPNLDTVIKFSIELSDCVTAVSESLKRDTKKILGTKRPIEVIYNFYTPEKITESPAKIRRSLKLKPRDFVAIHLSNLRPVKRIPDLLKIAARLKKYKNFKLLILAGGDFKEYQPLAKKLKLEKTLIAIESVKDIHNFINAADAGIYTSEVESFGMGMLETMAYGKPVLATKVGGVPEVLRNGTDGYLFKVGDVRGFADKLKVLMEKPALAAKLGQNASARAKEKFSADAIVKQYLDHYRRTCGLK